eukprot:gb/GECG01015332.1/.p1 GENE.gb/GECG01015332.1/~~gb/GECG01015332.1/.p1  ORF type:complete len:182 (+),score=15.75 gb/GECG01015332.1/:1-546(+)
MGGSNQSKSKEEDETQKAPPPQHQQSFTTQIPERLAYMTDCAVAYLSPDKWSPRYPGNVFTLTIPSYSWDAQGRVTYYDIRLKIEDQEITVRRRYREFVTLRKQLLANKHMEPYKDQIPELPDKTWTRPTDDQVLERRRRQLEVLLQNTLRFPSAPRLACIRSFLNLPYPQALEPQLDQQG